jgi:hypothetical protein
MINHTDLIGFVPKAILTPPLFNLKLRVLPVPLPSIMIYMIYHQTQINTPVLFADRQDNPSATSDKNSRHE